MKVKICGMCRPQNIADAAQLNPDYMGFIFYRKSPRYAGNLDPDAVKALPRNICRVGVFVDASCDEIMETVSLYRLDTVQLHGNESPEMCNSLAKECTVIKAIPVHSADDVTEAAELYGQAADYLLFDTKSPLPGGSGQQFDWSLLETYRSATPFFLSGGIAPGDASRLKALQHPLLHAVDINSRFETEPGLKDMRLLKGFLEETNDSENFFDSIDGKIIPLQKNKGVRS